MYHNIINRTFSHEIQNNGVTSIRQNMEEMWPEHVYKYSSEKFQYGIEVSRFIVTQWNLNNILVATWERGAQDSKLKNKIKQKPKQWYLMNNSNNKWLKHSIS